MINLLLSLAFVAPFQDEQEVARVSPEAEAVIEKFVHAKGGEAVLRSIKNYVIRGDMLSNGQSMGSFEIFQAPGRHFAIHRFPDGSSFRHGTDGKIAGQLDNAGVPSILDGPQAAEYIRHHETLHESLEWKNQYDAILYAGGKKIDDEEVQHLIFITADHLSVNRYFSKATGLFIREEIVTAVDGKTEILVSKIQDYAEEENGSLVPRSRVNTLGSNAPLIYRITSVESNISSNDQRFQLPEPVSQLAEKLAK